MINFKKELEQILKQDPLGLLSVKPKSSLVRTVDQRLRESFQEITNFVRENGKEPVESRTNIRERKLFSRLKALREDPVKVVSLLDFDDEKLFKDVVIPEPKKINSVDDILEDDFLGILDEPGEESIFVLKNVSKETRMPDYVARRKKCKNFEDYQHIFTNCHLDIRIGKRRLLPFRNEQQISKNRFYILKGILLYVAEVGELIIENGKRNARLKCIFENETESDMLLRSLSAELYKDGRRVTESEEKLLSPFEGIEKQDEETGLIYIVKSLSSNPEINSIDDLYKIGFSKISIEERIKNASNDPTYLMAPVKIIATFECYNLNPQKLEQLLHSFFSYSCLNLDIFDNKGLRHSPREWFIAPLDIIEQAIHFILNGEIVDYKYDIEKQSIVGK